MANGLTNSINQFNKKKQEETAARQAAASSSLVQLVNQNAQANENNFATATLTTSSGKQYTLDRNQFDWIRNRYRNDWADTYGYDEADQRAKAAGQMNAKVYSSYNQKSALDNELRNLGLPSEKNLDKYLEDYNRWHTGGMDQVFSGMNLPNDYWTKTKGFYQQDMKNAYENTVEDQRRKALGLMPLKWEEKYTDTEIDDNLRARGLPPISEFGNYANRYNSYQGIDALYRNVAMRQTNLKLQGINDDDTEYENGTGRDLYAAAFYDELERQDENGNYVYGSIMDKFKNSPKPSSATPTGDYAYDRGAGILATSKDQASADDYDSYNAFSYDDYKSKYNDYYERYIANQKTTSGQTVRDALDVLQREKDAEATKAYYTVGKSAADAKAFADKYKADYPDSTPEQMFLDMEKNGVPDTEAYKVYETMKSEASGTNGWYDVVNGWTKTYGGVWSSVNDSDAPIPDTSKPLTAEQRDVQAEKDRVNAAQLYGQALVTGDNDALNYASERVKALGFDSQEALVESLKAEKSDQFVQAVKDAITVYNSAMAAYEDTAGYGAPSEASREPINKADEALRALGFKSIHDAIRYVGGEKEAMSPGRWVAQEGAKADSYVKSKKDSYANDEDTIDDTANTIKSTIAQLIDEDDELGKQLDVDAVLSVIDSISNNGSTNPTALRLALTDLGFLGDDLSGWAGDITAGWSDADKRKLNYYLGGDNFASMTAGEGGANNDWAEAGSSTYSRQLKSEDFSLYLEYALQQVNAGNMTEADAYNLLAAKGFQEEMDAYMPEEWHKAHFIENTAPGLWNNSREEDRLLWEEMTPEQQRDAAESMWDAVTPEQKSAMYEKGWWKFDPTVYRTFGQALEQQFRAVLPGLASEIISTPVKVLDAIEAGISGRPDMWETTQDLMAFQQRIGQLGAVTDNVNGADVASVAADVAQELARMHYYGSIGGAIGASFAKTAVGAAVMSGAASNSKVVRGVSNMFMSMVKSSPFMVSAFANNYSEVKALGASNSEATWFGLITGLSEGAMEGLEFDQLWGKALGQKNFAELLTTGKHTYLERLGIIGKSWISSAAVSGLGEFTEESIGYVLETFLKMRHSDTWGKGTEWSTEDWLKQAMMGFITGALGGGIAAGGSWVADGVKLTNAMKNNPQLQAELPDILAGQGIAQSLPESAMAAYRDGGAEVMSKENYGNIIDQISDDYTAIFNAGELLDKTKAEAKAEYDTKVNEINATISSAVAANVNDSGKLSEFVKKCKKLGVNIDFDTIWNTDPTTWVEQIQTQTRAAKQNALDNAKAEYDAAISKAEADYNGNVKQKQRLIENNRKKVQEHFVGLYLQNEGLLSSMNEEFLQNIAQAYQNGAKYEPKGEDQNAPAGESTVDPDNIPWFSKKSKLKAQGVEARPFTDADAQKVVDVAKALKYKGGITFVDEPNANWQGSITKSNGNIVINKAKLSANDIQKLQNNPAMWVLEHELVHYMGEQGTAAYKKFHDAVVSMLKNSPYINGNDSTYNAVIDGMIQSRSEQGLGTLTREQAEEELVANFAMEYLFDSEDAVKSLFQTNGSVGQQILSWLRYKIDRAKLRRSKESWARDILDIERMYAKAYRETRSKSSTENSDKAYSAASEQGYEPGQYDFTKSFGEQVRDYESGKFPPHQALLVGNTQDSDALESLGFSNVPITYSTGHLSDAIKANADPAHKANAKLLEQLPEALKHPVAVIASDSKGKENNSVVVFTELKYMYEKAKHDRNGNIVRDKDGNVVTEPVLDRNGRPRYDLRMAAVALDGRARVNGEDVDSLHVTSFYAKPASLLETALKKEKMGQTAVFYFDRKKASDFLARAGVQFPGGYKVKDGLNHTLDEEGSPVKGWFVDRTGTRQFDRWFGQKRNPNTGEVTERYPGSISKFVNSDGSPRVMYKVPGTESTFTTKPSGENDTGYYLNANRIVGPETLAGLAKRFGSEDAAIQEIRNRQGADIAGDRVALRRDMPDGTKEFTILDEGDAKLATEGYGLYDRTIKDAAYAGEDESLDWLGEESQDEEDPYADWDPTDDDVYDPWGTLADAVYGTSGSGEFSRERVHAPADTGVTEAYRPRNDNDVGEKLTRTGDEYSRRNWTPRPPHYMVVDGEFVGRDNPDTGVTAADDEEYMQAVINGDYEKAAEMKRAVAERINSMTIAHGEQRGYAYDSINYGRDFGGAPNYFGSTDVNTAQTYANNHAVGRDVRTFRVAPNEFDLIEKVLADDMALMSDRLHRVGNGTKLGLDLSYVLEDNLIEPDDPVLMFADSELTPEQASELEEYPMRPVYRVYDKDTGEVLARTYPVSNGRGTTTDAIAMLHDLEDRLNLPRSWFIGGNLAGGVQIDYVMPGDMNTYEGSSAYWDEVPTSHDENAQPVDVEFLARNGGTLMLVVDQETGEVLHDKQFDGYGPEALTHLKQIDVQRAFDEWYGKGEDLWKFATYNAKPLDASSDDMYTKGMMVYNLYDSDGDTPAFVETVPDWNRSTTDEIGRADYGQGYDATLIKNISDASDSLGRNTITDVYMGHNPALIKSASPIELKRNGEIIPLSEMFNDLRNDMRYSASSESVEDLLRRYGAIEPGREPRARDVQVPRQTNDMNRVSQWIRSLIESGKLTDDQAQNVLRTVVEQDYGTYIPTSQSERMEEARAYIAERQPLQAQQEFHDMVMQGKFGVKTNALGIQLLSDASARGDIASVLDIAADLQLAATEAGQSAQIFNVLKELKGVGSAWYMQKVIDRMNAKYADRIAAGKMNRISADPALMAELAKATTVDQMAAAEEAVAKDIARQLPLTWDDRLSSWRYFSMLANPTTHIRNITGNLLMKGLNAAKDAVATGIENVLNVDQADRAHAILSQADKNTWGNWAQQSYEEQARNLSGGGKLGFETFVKQNTRSFDTKWLDAIAKFNFNALEGEDVAFIRPAYKNALMQHMKAQGYTLNEKGVAGKINAKGKFVEMTKAQQNAAIDWASQQAWKQTFRDASSLATMLNKLSKENVVSRLLVEGVMPFKKTPINIARRGVDYSPAGIIKGIAQLTNGVKKGKVTTAQAIDTLSSGITGSALMALGVMLAKLGVIRAGGEKDKKLETFLEDTGDQTYAMKFGDKSINMSSIAPATIPLFMGVALNEMIEQGGDSLDLSTITDTIAGTLNPFMEMSFMSSLNSALKNYNANGIGGALGSTLMTAAQNYGSQYLPTLGGKVAQFIDPTQRTTKSDATSPIGGNMDYYVRSLAKKVPGLEATLQPDVDVWGRTTQKDSFGEWALDFANKFILPTQVKVTNRDSVDRELIRVVESTGVTDFLPSDGNKYFTVNKQKYTMNARQYTQYSQERGQAAYAALKDTMAGASYKNASDEQKAAMLKKAIDAAYKQVSSQWKEKLGAYDNK